MLDIGKALFHTAVDAFGDGVGFVEGQFPVHRNLHFHVHPIAELPGHEPVHILNAGMAHGAVTQGFLFTGCFVIL